MKNKNIIIIAVAIVAAVLVAGGVYAIDLFNFNNNEPQETTHFKADFMEGDFVGNVSLENETEKFMQSYQDKAHDIIQHFHRRQFNRPYGNI